MGVTRRCPAPETTGKTIQFERAGPRSHLYFRPGETKAAIMTCGGLCPGVNDVVRSVFLEMHFRYGVRDILGIQFEYAGLDPANGFEPIRIDAEMVEDIHRNGGSIFGTSRGPVDPKVAIEYLQQHRINILFCVGGDGTLRGAHHLNLEARSRGYDLAVIVGEALQIQVSQQKRASDLDLTDAWIPKLDVAGSNPVSRSIVHYATAAASCHSARARAASASASESSTPSGKATVSIVRARN